jgi:hypothetical protein
MTDTVDFTAFRHLYVQQCDTSMFCYVDSLKKHDSVCSYVQTSQGSEAYKTYILATRAPNDVFLTAGNRCAIAPSDVKVDELLMVYIR